jgi:hypothetical protein
MEVFPLPEGWLFLPEEEESLLGVGMHINITLQSDLCTVKEEEEEEEDLSPCSMCPSTQQKVIGRWAVEGQRRRRRRLYRLSTAESS